jgi:DNA topoisomerase VI subunit B
MKDIFVIDHVGLIGGENNIDDETRKSYQTMAKRLKELAKRNMRVLERKEKIKRILYF